MGQPACARREGCPGPSRVRERCAQRRRRATCRCRRGCWSSGRCQAGTCTCPGPRADRSADPSPSPGLGPALALAGFSDHVRLPSPCHGRDPYRYRACDLDHARGRGRGRGRAHVPDPCRTFSSGAAGAPGCRRKRLDHYRSHRCASTGPTWSPTRHHARVETKGARRFVAVRSCEVDHRPAGTTR